MLYKFCSVNPTVILLLYTFAFFNSGFNVSSCPFVTSLLFANTVTVLTSIFNVPPFSTTICPFLFDDAVTTLLLIVNVSAPTLIPYISLPVTVTVAFAFVVADVLYIPLPLFVALLPIFLFE